MRVKVTLRTPAALSIDTANRELFTSGSWFTGCPGPRAKSLMLTTRAVEAATPKLVAKLSLTWVSFKSPLPSSNCPLASWKPLKLERRVTL